MSDWRSYTASQFERELSDGDKGDGKHRLLHLGVVGMPDVESCDACVHVASVEPCVHTELLGLTRASEDACACVRARARVCAYAPACLCACSG